jgi:hypothetical protein
MALTILLARCERCQTTFETAPRPSLMKEDEHIIDCPTCHRGYYGELEGGYWSDRELSILARAVVDPFKSNVALAEEQP